MSVEERRKQPVCGKCSKSTRKKPPGTWPTGWSCDSTEHKGSNSFTKEDCVWGFPTLASAEAQVGMCNWGMCGVCWKREQAKKTAVKAQPVCGKCSKCTRKKPPALSEQIAQAAKRGPKPWGRSKIMIVGEGRAGKSALANSIIGRPFSQTESTVGINQLTCDI
ncbi:hypothetical protein B484DRAFT_468763, partial [Ochromonadaceae sp. CCMP2298]